HPRARAAVPGVPPAGGEGGGGADRVALHAQARELAERGRVRTGRALEAVPEPADRVDRGTAAAGGRLGGRPGPPGGRGEAAGPGQGRPHPTSPPVPVASIVVTH